MISKTITQECSTYKIKKGFTVKIWKDDNKLSILLPEDTIDLQYNDVYELSRVISVYMFIHNQKGGKE